MRAVDNIHWIRILDKHIIMEKDLLDIYFKMNSYILSVVFTF